MMTDALTGARVPGRPRRRRINFALLPVALLELFNTDKYLNNLINYGIEGTHYVKVSDNVIKAGLAVDQYNLGMQWMFGNQFINYLYSNEDPKKWDKFNAFNKAALPLKSLGSSLPWRPAPWMRTRA
jgi:putative aldouronate transport system substrate-binding protein